MPAPQDTQQLYEELAEHCSRRHDLEQRDVFLVLAADIAYSTGRVDQAERLCQRLLQLSPHTLLRPFASFVEAMKSHDIREYVADLRQQFPVETATKLLVEWRLGGSVSIGTVSPKPPLKTIPILPGPIEKLVKKPGKRSNEDTPKRRKREGQGILGRLFVYLLAAAVALLALALLGMVFVRPFMQR